MEMFPAAVCSAAAASAIAMASPLLANSERILDASCALAWMDSASASSITITTVVPTSLGASLSLTVRMLFEGPRWVVGGAPALCRSISEPDLVERLVARGRELERHAQAHVEPSHVLSRLVELAPG